jgi:hypothetical protein
MTFGSSNPLTPATESVSGNPECGSQDLRNGRRWPPHLFGGTLEIAIDIPDAFDLVFASGKPTYPYKRMRRFRVRFGDLAACSPCRSWAGYTISMFEFEFPTRAGNGQQPARLVRAEWTQISSPAARLWRGLRTSHALVERQIGNHTASNSPGIYDDLVCVREQSFHRFKVHALTSDLRRLLVFVVDLEKAGRRALGLGDGLLAIGFGVLDGLRGTAARLRNNLVGVGLRLILRPLKVGAGSLHVAERVDHLLWRIDLLQLHLRDLNARPVSIERRLHQFLYGGLNGLSLGQNWLKGGAADNFAHGAFCNRLDRSFGLLDVETDNRQRHPV